MRRDFGRLNGGAITYAPDTLKDGDSYIIAPRAEDYDRLGWLPVVDEPPETDAAHYAAPTGWTIDGAVIRRVYEVRENPPPPTRVFKRSYIAQWIRARGLWSAFGVFLDQNDEFAFLWLYSTEFDEDNAQWPTALAAFKAALSLTDAEADAMLEFGATGGVA